MTVFAVRAGTQTYTCVYPHKTVMMHFSAHQHRKSSFLNYVHYNTILCIISNYKKTNVRVFLMQRLWEGR